MIEHLHLLHAEHHLHLRVTRGNSLLLSQLSLLLSLLHQLLHLREHDRVAQGGHLLLLLEHLLLLLLLLLLAPLLQLLQSESLHLRVLLHTSD